MIRKLKKILFRYLKTGKLVFIGKPVYKAIITIELLFHRLVDLCARTGSGSQDNLNSDLTVLVKTFERPRTVKRLIKSIKRFYPNLRIILVDDSKYPVQINGIETVVMPFDSGISAGRNKALSLVKTEFVLVLDDDFVFFRKTDLVNALKRIKANPNIDILGGEVIDLPFYKTFDYYTAPIFATVAQPTMPTGSLIDGMPVLDKVANFYIGRTHAIKKIKWDNLLKRLDHADFFTRAKGVLTSVLTDEFKCLHARTIYNRTYMSFRNNLKRDQIYLFLKYNHESNIKNPQMP
ncbi:putative lipopolysaccharide N-acetyl-glycoaminyltransferase [Desulforapulum autotrophicum HRM2]|uniref:Lipopolysaccharide N-acetyl-glycoaminyltransferase n=1 Tax=Desulforapulum autotrophicum (strain ATCC 43914 / DSM 3382 / VKM B-1955 / HRM2) TaxID=177437 RepID=C0QGY8_DESAH|nr:glycosyltransferase [Desulforapulum autotrophicum]ACN15637.1 putative lipopolysaccharide N-acetyl-glycoaminyltransferase [Desulforapulum autotrophicum HRM2]